MFRLLRLRPPHGWHAVAWELLIVTLGVLIALAAQQVAEGWQWRQRTDEARTRLARELGAMSAQLYERLIVQPCLLNRLNSLADRLGRGGAEWEAAPEQYIGSERYFSNRLPVAYRPPHRDLVDGFWVNIQNDGTLAHLGPDEAERIAAVYASARSIQNYFNQEQQMATMLGPLASDLVLGPGDKTRMLQAIYSLDRLNSNVVSATKNMINDVGKLRLPFDRPAIRKSRQNFLDLQRGYRGVCVDALPLDAGFDDPVLGVGSTPIR